MIFRTLILGQCRRCHDAGGEGRRAGPVLAGIGARVDREYLLQSLLDPSARIADGFATISVTLKDGEVLDGLKLQETDRELKLRLASGEVRTVAMAAIEQRSANPLSVMPPMGDVLTPRELRDVVALLAGWKSNGDR